MIVSKKNLKTIVDELSTPGNYALDTETTGLYPYLGDRPFSIIISGEGKGYYFNLQPYDDLADEFVLSPEDLKYLNEKVFSSRNHYWFLHNAKFDLHMLKTLDIDLKGEIHCTMTFQRFIDNRGYLKDFSLARLATQINLSKSEEVDLYIKKHKLYADKTFLGDKKPLFNKVPFDVISKYGLQDGLVTEALGNFQLLKIKELWSQVSAKKSEKIIPLITLEKATTKILQKMEEIGIKINRDYCERALDYERERLGVAVKKLEELTGGTFKDSNKVLAELFRKAGEEFPKTEKGNPSFTDAVLEGMTSPLASLLREYRGARKIISTYYENFLALADSEDIIHTNIRQGGTETGRFSCSDPNLQNIPKEEDTSQEFIVRRAFVPREDFCFVMIDYDQQEYRLMLDRAQELGVIKKILEENLDVHTATAELMGVKRTPAKTLNFMLLYGGGSQKLANALGLTLAQAQELRKRYFSALPNVGKFIRGVIKQAEEVGYVFNWAGRKYHFTRELSYKAPNAIIQGGGADVMRCAMKACHDLLINQRALSRPILTVHDELLFEIHKSEIDLVPKLKKAMESAYKPIALPLTCSVSHSWVSWGDKVSGMPDGKET